MKSKFCNFLPYSFVLRYVDIFLVRQVDDVVPSLLVLPAGTELHTHDMVKDGRLVLQGTI